ncbi:protein cornichon homolog 1-like isoform X1 [Momordica charantia]|uniref:Protein cornichon homolog 1-like isoform X1 n=1 Tax=Momordica charantia TaxID=3673 RepID=A0A6J1DBU0_MOMCH|nr:protein cornichon homolog 1-like isoform X1 [Momordica charantia]XP_022151665.1 protein cornichon homolog 1-like isoform X1 [Momordica charantia]
MAWNLIFWFISFCINVALLVFNFYQLLVLTDLEADYLNIYDSSSRINKLVIPEFIVQGVFCSLFLLTGHWFMFLITVPVSCYHIRLFLKREHLIDVTEVFRVLKREKYFRLGKLIFYLLMFLIVIFRIIVAAGMNSVFDSAPEDIDIRSTVLEF